MSAFLQSTTPWRKVFTAAIGIALALTVFRITADEVPAPAQKVKAAPARIPLLRVVDLNLGEEQQVTLSNGKKVAVRLVKLVETRDSVRSAVRRAEVTVE